MQLKISEYDFTICQVRNLAGINYKDDIFFLTKEKDQFTLICKTKFTPANANLRTDGWKALCIETNFMDEAFCIAQLLLTLSQNLREIAISSLADTTYIFIKEQELITAVRTLVANDYQVE